MPLVRMSAKEIRMEEAIRTVKDGCKSILQVAKEFNVDKTTLRCRAKGTQRQRIGRPMKFPPDEEEEFLLVRLLL